MPALSTTLIRSFVFVFVGLLLASLSSVNAQSEDGFRTLFDGVTTDGWTRYGQSDDVGGWTVEDGALHRAAAGGDLMTNDQFGNFDFRFDWKVAPGGNSGVMYRVKVTDAPAYVTGPEYQILDNAGHADGKATLTSAASLYGLYAPTENVARPAGEWNTGRIVVQGNRIQHWLNDKLVVDTEFGSDDWNERIRNSKFQDWDEFARSPRGHIVLQDHGDPVWYRNLRIKELE